MHVPSVFIDDDEITMKRNIHFAKDKTSYTHTHIHVEQHHFTINTHDYEHIANSYNPLPELNENLHANYLVLQHRTFTTVNTER